MPTDDLYLVIKPDHPRFGELGTYAYTIPNGPTVLTFADGALRMFLPQDIRLFPPVNPDKLEEAISALLSEKGDPE